MAREATDVWDRYAAGYAFEDATWGGPDVWCRALPLQHDKRLFVAAN